MPHEDIMPGTLKRSSSEAQDLWAHAYDSAVDRYGGGHHAWLTAFAALKCEFKRVSGRWEPKRHDPETRQGDPSEMPRSSRRDTRPSSSDTANPVLLYLADRLGIEHADGLPRSDVLEAVSEKMGLSAWERRPAE